VFHDLAVGTCGTSGSSGGEGCVAKLSHDGSKFGRARQRWWSLDVCDSASFERACQFGGIFYEA
jgi:hypothetical protein